MNKAGESSAVDENDCQMVDAEMAQDKGTTAAAAAPKENKKDRKVTVCVGKFNTEIDAQRAYNKVSSEL